jgi:hypothetical protein
MCGDLEEEDRLEGDLYQRFLVHSRALLEKPPSGGDLNRYLDGLFNDLLSRCVRDAEAVASPNAYREVAMQSLVLARLAGFLAGHVALNEDPMRKLLEAAMLGYQEAESPPQRDHHGHTHARGHDHDHNHEHEHDHHDGHAHPGAGSGHPEGAEVSSGPSGTGRGH